MPRKLLLILVPLLALFLIAATLYSSPQSYLDRLVPRLQWSQEKLSGTSSYTTLTQTSTGTEIPQVIRWSQPVRIATRSALGDLCACWSMTSTMASIRWGGSCGTVIDAYDGGSAVPGLCALLPAGTISEMAVRKTDFLTAGVGQRSGVCSTPDAGRPCRVDGDCYYAATCTSGGVTLTTTEDVLASGAYLLFQAADGSTAGRAVVSIVGSEHR